MSHKDRDWDGEKSQEMAQGIISLILVSICWYLHDDLVFTHNSSRFPLQLSALPMSILDRFLSHTDTSLGFGKESRSYGLHV